jgi:AraC family transcriptional activator of pobA
LQLKASLSAPPQIVSALFAFFKYCRMKEDDFLLSEFKKVLLKNVSVPVIDLDEQFPYKLALFAQVHEILIDKIGNQIPPHRWSYYRVGLITKGGADYTVGIYKFKAYENTLVLIPPRVVTSSSNWAEDTKGFFVLFNLEFFLQSHFPHRYLDNKKILQPSIRPYIHLTPQQADEVMEIFQTIVVEKEGANSHKNELIALKIIELLILSERLYSELDDFEDNHITLEIVKKFSSLVESNFMEERSVSFYASALNIHPNYLNALIKSQTGLTAKESIQSRLLLESKYLLNSTSLSIKEISNELGFKDPNYFTVFFKRIEGIPPVAYRGSFV